MTESKAKAAAGWYDHPSLPDKKRYWNGMAWTDDIAPRSTSKNAPRALAKNPPPESPYGYILLGFIISVIGGGCIGVGIAEGEDLILLTGYLVAGIGWVMTMVGIIGAGVRMGMRHIVYERGD
jgi:hypothetical protein